MRRRELLAAAVASVAASSCKRQPTRPAAASELWLGGDVHFGSGRFAGIEGLGDALDGAAGVVNLEGPVVAGPQEAFDGARPVRLMNSRDGLDPLVAAGVRVVSIANNHSRDSGDNAPLETADALTFAGLVPVGLIGGPALLTLGDRRVTITAHDLSQGIPAELERELRDARARAGALVSTFHVTGPPSYLPDKLLRDAVDIALAEGASIIASHGTHALGPVERRGEQVIAWGLGNLAFACDCTDQTDGAILRVSISGGAGFSGLRSAPANVRARILPIDAGLHGAPARPSHNPALIVDLLRALGSSPLSVDGLGASF